MKPTYELRAGALAARPEDVVHAVVEVKRALVETGWQSVGQSPSPSLGANGAVEMFVLAQVPCR